MKRRVYLAGPITKGDLSHNINQGTNAFLALAKAGIAPMCPMWSAFSGNAYTADAVYPQTVNARFGVPVDLSGKTFAVAGAIPNDLTHADWLAVDFAWIAACDAVLRLPGESVGADAEVAEAERIGIPVFHEVSEVIAWAKLAPLDVPAVLERINSDDLAPEGMAGTLLHTPSDPAGTKLGDLPLVAPPAQAPGEQYRPDGTPVSPTFLPDLPTVDPGESLLSQDVRLREMERDAAK